MKLCFTLTEIDWAVTKDVVSIAGTFFSVMLATLGLTTWRRQLRGTSEYSLAKKLIHLTYELQQLIQEVRNPMISLRREEVEAGNSLREEQRIYNERMSALYLKWAELQTARLESKVIWQLPAYDCFHDLHKNIGELRAALWLHFWMKGAFAGPGAVVDRNPERIRENDKVIYMISEEDEFSMKISSSVKKIENFFAGKVRGS